MKTLLAVAVFLILSGCSTWSAERRHCRTLQESGQVLATIDSCVKCVRHLGYVNPQTLQGCAMGMDAASLMR